jgi:hypothetical protein
MAGGSAAATAALVFFSTVFLTHFSVVPTIDAVVVRWHVTWAGSAGISLGMDGGTQTERQGLLGDESSSMGDDGAHGVGDKL